MESKEPTHAKQAQTEVQKDTKIMLLEGENQLLINANSEHVLLNKEMSHNLKIYKDRIAELEHIILVHRI